MALQQSIIYISRNGFGYYSSQNSIWFAFPPLVKDLEVINKTEFVNAIEVFIDKNQIFKASCFVVLSENVYFERDFTGIPQDQQETALQTFVDTVPFENTLKKTFPIENGFKVVVVNKDLCMFIRQAFLEKGFIFESITPVLAIGSQVVEDENGINQESINLLFQKIAVLRQNSFSLIEQVQQIKPIPQPLIQQANSTEKNNTKLFWLLGIFSVLLLFLAAMLSGKFF